MPINKFGSHSFHSIDKFGRTLLKHKPDVSSSKSLSPQSAPKALPKETLYSIHLITLEGQTTTTPIPNHKGLYQMKLSSGLTDFVIPFEECILKELSSISPTNIVVLIDDIETDFISVIGRTFKKGQKIAVGYNITTAPMPFLFSFLIKVPIEGK